MLVGTFLVQKLSNTLLQIIFLYFYGLYHIWITDQEKEAERVENAQDPVVSKPALTTGGSLVGFISSFIGIAGGTI